MHHNMLPALELQIPPLTSDSIAPYLANETSVFPAILALRQGVLIQTAKLAQAAQSFRHEAAGQTSVSPGSYARWQANVSQLQSELTLFWVQAYPEFLKPESAQAGHNLPSRVRYVFEYVSPTPIVPKQACAV